MQKTNKQHLGFGKYQFKKMLGNFNDIEHYEIQTGYRYFIANTPEHVEFAMKNYALQTGCLLFESIDKDEYEQAIGVTSESNTQIQQK